MPTPKDLYINGIHKKFGYLAAWLPGQTIALGDTGVMEGKAFRRLACLADQGIAFMERIDRGPVPLDHTSAAGVTIGLNAAATAAGAPPVQGSVAVRFDQKGGFVFRAQGCLGRSISDPIDLENQLRAAYDDGRWDLSWVVVTEVVHAESATIVISNSDQAHLQMSVRGSLEAAKASLASAKAGLHVESQSGDMTSFIAQRGLTPLYRVSRLKRGLFFAPPRFDAVRSGGEGDPGDEAPAPAPHDPFGPPRTEELVLSLVTFSELPSAGPLLAP